MPFDPEGVWPMRDNPSSRGLTPGTKAYYATKVFHSTYHTLLQKLEVWWAPGWPSGGHDYHGITGSASQQTNAAASSQWLKVYM